jgi:hypothetical protein
VALGTPEASVAVLSPDKPPSVAGVDEETVIVPDMIFPLLFRPTKYGGDFHVKITDMVPGAGSGRRFFGVLNVN